MKRALLFVFFPMLACAADGTGSWHLVLERFGEEFADARAEFKTEGKNLTGTLNELKLEGTAEPRFGRERERHCGQGADARLPAKCEAR